MLRVCEDILLRRICGTKEERETGGQANIRSEMFHEFYSSIDGVRMGNGNDMC
jgi:hypothetical protein